MDDSKVFMFPENKSGIDPTTALLLGNNNGFGGMNNPLWMFLMYPLILPFLYGGYGGFGGFGGGYGAGNGAGFLSNQLNNDAGRDLILQALNGRADALGQIAQITNNSVDSVRDAVCTLNSKLSEVGSQIGMTGMQVINAIQAGDASLASKLAECCCENRLAIANQTNALQSQIAANDANIRLQLATSAGEDRLAMCQQTNNISNQMDRNTNAIMGAIANQNTLLAQEFCALKEREMQNKIDSQSDLITQLRGQISNDAQTATFTRAFNELDNKISAIAAKQPNTVPVIYPNLTAVNTTPNATTTTTFNNGNCGCGWNGWNNGCYPFGFGNVQNGFFN